MGGTQMKILFMFTIPSGGMDTLNRQREKALSSVGIECHFLYRYKGNGIQNPINSPVFITDDPLEWVEIALNHHYDAIVISYDLKMLKAIGESSFEGVIIYDNQGLGKRKTYAKQYIQTQAYPFLNQYCDAIMCPKTPHLMDAFSSFFPHKKKFFVDNGFDTESFQYQAVQKHPHPIIGWVGRIEENKNWRDFLRIGQSLRQIYPTLELWIFEDESVSYPSQRKAFQAFLKEEKLESAIIIHQSIPHEEMARYYSIIGDSGGFLCSTSKVEGFGYAVLEAMLCRCPVLATDSDGVKSFITHNVTGKFFEIHNIKMAVQEGKELMEDTSLRSSIVDHAFLHVQRKFSLKQYANAFSSMLRELVQ